jgi:primosomal protein N' (replication factor Y)
MAAGEGTERLEDTLQQRFPSARIVRVDTDSMSSDKRFDTLRQALIRHEVDILVGTQMLAKGHDFPNLTTVVVVNPDSALYSTDFRAEERLFAQLTQVAGRAGRRDKPGQVLVQTAHPEHPLFNALLHHDVEGYCDSLLEGRERFRFPPYTFQAKIQAQHRNEDVVCRFLESVHSALKARHCQGVTLYDPVPSSPPKIALKYRYQWLIQAEQRAYLHPAISVLMALLEQENTHRVQWSLDIDPQEV